MNIFSIPIFEKVVSNETLNHTQNIVDSVIENLKFTEEVTKTGTMLTSDEGVKNTNNFISRYNLSLLEKEILDSAAEYLDNIKIKSYENLSVFMSWLTKINPGNTSSKHIHDPSTLVGVYYCDFKPNQGNLKIFNPLPEEFQKDRFIDIEPAAGKLILFPGWLEHEVQENKSPMPRYSIAINIQIYETRK